jgi:hypothetical protein
MGFFTNVLLGVALAILALSLIYTMWLARGQKVLKSELDTKIPNFVQEHAYIRNPIFLAYALFFVLLILIIVFISGTTNW